MLKFRETGSALAVLLALLIALTGVPGVGWADDDDKKNSNDNRNKTEKAKPDAGQQTITPTGAEPDLKIEYVGFNAPGVNDQLIKFKITNVGKEPSVAIKARVETLTPQPTPWFREIDVPVVAPGASTEIHYPLAASCNGHRVRALVNAPGDTNLANNVVEATVCPTGQAGKPQGAPSVTDVEVVTAINGTTVKDVDSSDRQATPEHLRKGDHTLEVEPSVLRRHGLKRIIEGLRCFGDFGYGANPSTYNVGFVFNDMAGCEQNTVTQLIVDFDLSWLNEIEKKLIHRAELRYGEQVVHAENGDAHDVTSRVSTCVDRLGAAPLGYDAIINDQQLLRTENSEGGRLTSGWEVTRDVQWSVAGNRWQGWVLHGYDEDLDAESDRVCVSMLSNVRLYLHYSIL